MRLWNTGRDGRARGEASAECCPYGAFASGARGQPRCCGAVTPTRSAAQRSQRAPPARSLLTTASGITVMVTSLSSCNSRAWLGVMGKVLVQNPFTAFPVNALKIVVGAFAAESGQGAWVLQVESEIGLGFPGAILRSSKRHSRSFPPYCGSARSAWCLNCSTRECFDRFYQVISIFYFASNIR